MRALQDDRSSWLSSGFPAPGMLTRAAIDPDYAAAAACDPMSLLPSRTILSCIRSAAAANPAKPSLMLLEAGEREAPARSVSYAELVSGIERAAGCSLTPRAAPRRL